MTKERVAATDAMVNLDTLGLAPSEVWISHSDKRLSNALAYIAKQINAPLSAVNVERVGSSDGEQFAERNIPRITIHSLTQRHAMRGFFTRRKTRFPACGSTITTSPTVCWRRTWHTLIRLRETPHRSTSDEASACPSWASEVEGWSVVAPQ
jgi:hypothetical protein